MYYREESRVWPVVRETILALNLVLVLAVIVLVGHAALDPYDSGAAHQEMYRRRAETSFRLHLERRMSLLWMSQRAFHATHGRYGSLDELRAAGLYAPSERGAVDHMRPGGEHPLVVSLDGDKKWSLHTRCTLRPESATSALVRCTNLGRPWAGDEVVTRVGPDFGRVAGFPEKRR